ncbi:MAG: mobile mystery protein A [Candidatus Kapaibacterium sp.]
MKNLELQRRQLDRIFTRLKMLSEIEIPNSGWIRAIRSALGMPLAAAGKKFGMTPEGVLMLEKREAEGSITLNGLREAASALECTLLYAVVPKIDLESMLRSEAERMAGQTMSLASTTMLLEGQSTSKEELEEARRMLIEKLMANPKLIWREQK